MGQLTLKLKPCMNLGTYLNTCLCHVDPLFYFNFPISQHHSNCPTWFLFYYFHYYIISFACLFGWFFNFGFYFGSWEYYIKEEKPLSHFNKRNLWWCHGRFKGKTIKAFDLDLSIIFFLKFIKNVLYIKIYIKFHLVFKITWPVMMLHQIYYLL